MKFEMVSGDERWFDGAPDWALFVSKAQAGLYWEEEAKQVKGNKYQHTDWDAVDRYTGSGKMNKIIAERRPIAEPESSAEWNGEGLPPVGGECEVNDERTGLWSLVDSVLAHAFIRGLSVAVFQIGDYIAYSPADRFRPIRSPQEIARDEAINGMAEIIECRNGCSPKPLAGWLYDAGYRKLE